MEVDTYLSAISTKAELISLIALVEEEALEELFVAQSLDAGVAGQTWKAGQVLVFCFSSKEASAQKLHEISQCINLDTLDEAYFEVIDGAYVLKSVFFPETEGQEEQIIAHLA